MLYFFLSICVIVSPCAATAPRVIEPGASGDECVPCMEVEWNPCPCPDGIVESPCGPCEEVEWAPCPCPCPDMIAEEPCGPCGNWEATPSALSLPSSPVHAASWHSLGSKFGLGSEWSRGAAAQRHAGFGFGGGNLPSGGGGSPLSDGGSPLVRAGQDSSAFPHSGLSDDPFPQYGNSTAPPAPTGSVSVVPEPGSLVLWSGLALIGVIAAWRRHRLT